MKDFFLNSNSGIIFKLFNFPYFIILGIFLITFILIIYNKSKFIEIPDKIKKIIRIAYGLILLVFLIIRRGTFIYYGVYNWKIHLDIGFCNMTNILFIIYCFTGYKKLYNICYYCAYCGPLAAVLFPSVNVSINNFSFLIFLIFHHVTFLMNIIFSLFENKQYVFKESLLANIFIFIYFLICNCFNVFFGTMYNHPNKLIERSIFDFINCNLCCNVILLIIGTTLLLFGNYVLKCMRGEKVNEKY